MQKSESIVNLTKALLRAQKKIEHAEKSSVNPHFRSKYAGLPEVIDACKKQLNDEGIIVIQPVVSTTEGDFVETTLIHSDTGEFITAPLKMVLDKESMQAMGSAITYSRRYAIQSMVFLASEDDDAEKAEGRGNGKEVKKPTEEQINERKQEFRKKEKSL